MFICKWYARISFELLTRPIDTESEEVANAVHVLADVTYQLIAQNGAADGDILEAEKLFRKTVRINKREPMAVIIFIQGVSYTLYVKFYSLRVVMMMK